MNKVYQSTVITVHVIMSLNSYQVVLWTNAGEKEQLRQSYSFIKKNIFDCILKKNPLLPEILCKKWMADDEIFLKAEHHTC